MLCSRAHLGWSPVAAKKPARLAGRGAPRQSGPAPVRASGQQDAEDAPLPKVPKQRRRGRQQRKEDFSIGIDTLNPVTMGRKSREVFDDVWSQLQRIGNPARSSQAADQLTQLVGDSGEFKSPAAPDTTILVTGATGRVGRILVRKLLLRGYQVRALVRQRSAAPGSSVAAVGAAAVGTDDAVVESGGSLEAPGSGGGEEAIPQAVEQVYGDVADYEACRAAVAGVDKVICCSGARSAVTADLARVDEAGVANLARALQDELNQRARQQGMLAPVAKREIADFRNEVYHAAWDVVAVGQPQAQQEGGEEGSSKSRARRRSAQRATARDTAECYIDGEDNLVFEGAVYSRGGLAEVGAALAPEQAARLAGSEGLMVRARADEHPYTCVLRTAGGYTYATRFSTRPGYNSLRLPWNTFRPVGLDAHAPVLEPADVEYIGFRFEPRIKRVEEVTEPGQSMFDVSAHRFKLEVDWIKTLPGGQETDFVLVSCAGTQRPGMSEQERDKVLSFKRRGEVALRNSGLGYTIVRPGPLMEEAGGYKALVFDQGNRISQGISCADVADVCLRALHNPEARNKTFEVCFEYQPEEGLEFYELISHLPDKSNSYLTPALAPLAKNT